MTRVRVLAAIAVGIVFGATLCWSGMADPDVIRGALLLEQSYLFLFFGSAVAVAAVGNEILRRTRPRALLAEQGEERLVFSRQRPQRRHLVGSLIFGLGWGIANVCPGPIAAQVGMGIPWVAFTLVGAVGGIFLFMRGGRAETEPSSDAPAAPARPPSRPRFREEPTGAG
jgi:uncharacterized membrane protein YedE/YeeE